MSYPSYDSDDYPTTALAKEIDRRVSKHRNGLCWYCGRKLNESNPCRKHKIHSGAEV